MCGIYIAANFNDSLYSSCQTFCWYDCQSYSYVQIRRCEVVPTLTLVFLVITPRELVGIFRSFGETHCLLEAEDSMFLQNTLIYLQVHKKLLPRRPTLKSSVTNSNLIWPHPLLRHCTSFVTFAAFVAGQTKGNDNDKDKAGQWGKASTCKPQALCLQLYNFGVLEWGYFYETFLIYAFITEHNIKSTAHELYSSTSFCLVNI